MNDILEQLKQICLKLLGITDTIKNLPPVSPNLPPPVVLPPTDVPVVIDPPEPKIEPPKYLWNSPQNIRHSIRVICDEMGLTLEEKNTMCATIQAESGFKLTARQDNRNANGLITSTDWGLCQWNSYYHGKEITPQEAVHNPEKAVRLMAQYWKRGQRDLWIAYKNRSYLRYL